MANLKSKYKFIQEKFNKCMKNINFKNMFMRYFESYAKMYLNPIINNFNNCHYPYYFEFMKGSFIGYAENRKDTYWKTTTLDLNSDVCFTDFDIKEGVSVTDFHKRIINFIPYAFDELKEYFYTQLNIDKKLYDIEVNRVYNCTLNEDNLINYSQQYPCVVFNYINMYSDFGYQFYSKRMFVNNQNEEYYCPRAIYFYGSNMFTYNTLEMKDKNHYDYKDVWTDVKCDDDLKVSFYDPESESQWPYSISYHVLNNLSVIVRDKLNNKIAFLCNIIPNSQKIKIVKEGSGFSDAIALKRKVKIIKGKFEGSEDLYVKYSELNQSKYGALRNMCKLMLDRQNMYGDKIKDYVSTLVYNVFSSSKINAYVSIYHYPYWKNSEIIKVIKMEEMYNNIVIRISFPEYNNIITLDNDAFKANPGYYIQYWNQFVFNINNGLISLLVNYKWIYRNNYINNKKFRSKYKNDLQIIEDELKSNKSNYIDCRKSKYQFLLQDIPHIQHLVEYFYNKLDDIYDKSIEYRDELFDEQFHKDLENELKIHDDIVKDMRYIFNNYSLGAYAKKKLKSINEYDNIEDLLVHTNYYMGMGLNLQCTDLSKVIAL